MHQSNTKTAPNIRSSAVSQGPHHCPCVRALGANMSHQCDTKILKVSGTEISPPSILLGLPYIDGVVFGGTYKLAYSIL